METPNTRESTSKEKLDELARKYNLRIENKKLENGNYVIEAFENGARGSKLFGSGTTEEEAMESILKDVKAKYGHI